MASRFADDSSIFSVAPPNVSSPKVETPNVNPPDARVSSGAGMVDRMLDSVGLRRTEEGTA